MTIDSQRRLQTLLEKFDEKVRYEQRWLYNPGRALAPTAKQLEFHDAGNLRGVRFRCMWLGNQQGKTLAGGMELSFHMTGEYPEWWNGRRYDAPTKWWVGGVTHKSVRDNPQRILLGENRDWGSGTIPRDSLVGSPTMARGGVPDLVDSFQVTHRTGKPSAAAFKSYDEGREKWQGETLTGGIWYDEEPPYEIYSEGKARLIRYRTPLFITATPLMGMTQVVRMFYEPDPDDPELPQRKLIQGSIDDATFYSDEDKAEIIANWPEHERRARIHGLPVIGEGVVFPVPDEQVIIDPFPLPRHYRRLVGLDVGVSHPTAAVWIAYDPDTDTIYVYDTYKKQDPFISTHAAALILKGDWIPVSWPHDAIKGQSAGESIADQYRKLKVNMLPESARTYDDKGGPQAVEPIIHEMLERMRTNRLKVFSTLRDWFIEKANYHRKDGKPVDYMDDLMKATMYAIMMIRFAKPDMKTLSQSDAQSDYDPMTWSPS